MAYTAEQKTEMYQSVSGDLTGVIVKLQDFIESESAAADVSDEVSFAERTVNQLIALVGNCTVQAKRHETD